MDELEAAILLLEKAPKGRLSTLEFHSSLIKKRVLEPGDEAIGIIRNMYRAGFVDYDPYKGVVSLRNTSEARVARFEYKERFR